ncbi:hypothetical protein QBC47DRAFT_406500 [Echria macrotheca]|uniref:RING-type domain-containing protein n=1 Tax=Echria macrotheca TaxID=438768 RepID=A0AAJ0B336_9PEZI|nr:hypothetical protein QBC47DRAFT_406500 [Echria macrotheca]
MAAPAPAMPVPAPAIPAPAHAMPSYNTGTSQPANFIEPAIGTYQGGAYNHGYAAPGPFVDPPAATRPTHSYDAGSNYPDIWTPQTEVSPQTGGPEVQNEWPGYQHEEQPGREHLVQQQRYQQQQRLQQQQLFEQLFQAPPVENQYVQNPVPQQAPGQQIFPQQPHQAQRVQNHPAQQYPAQQYPYPVPQQASQPQIPRQQPPQAERVQNPPAQQHPVPPQAFELAENQHREQEASGERPSTQHSDGQLPDGDQTSSQNQRLSMQNQRPDDEQPGIDRLSKPLVRPEDMAEDLILRHNPEIMGKLQKKPVKLHVATLCSGTDAPIIGLSLLKEGCMSVGKGAVIDFVHHFSCEIEPFKQAFIRRNLPPDTIIFRDVVELATSTDGTATAAGGHKVAIPTQELDILYSGTSCVDYSTLNNKRGELMAVERLLASYNKSAEPPMIMIDQSFVATIQQDVQLIRDQVGAAGESSRTFLSALKLIVDRRPKAIIMENVSGAPWSMYQDFIFPKIGYAAKFVTLDSKKYYVPQTRQRGYLVAVDSTRITSTMEGLPLDQPEDRAATAMKLVNLWAKLMEESARQASAPVTAFLKPDDDPSTIQSRAEMETKQASRSSSSWDSCSLRHSEIRARYGLEEGCNPFSKKVTRGGRAIFQQFPYDSWRGYWEIQPTRVNDLMDISVAWGLKQKADIRFKPMLLDVSQNVDRQTLMTSTNPFNRIGLIGCITPSGQPILSNRGRPLTGTEVMALQGMPVDRMTLSTETQAQLQDLAGNAMTVTVVSAATISLLLAAAAIQPDLFTALPPGDAIFPAAYMNQVDPGTLKDAEGPRKMIHLADSWEPILDVVRVSCRICFCQNTVIPRKHGHHWLSCQDCGATACSECHGNPEHNYVPDAELEIRHLGQGAKVELRKLLPDRLVLAPLPDVDQLLREVKEDAYREVVGQILGQEVVYYLDAIHITGVVTVSYKAKQSLVRVVMTGNAAAIYIMVCPSHDRRAELMKILDIDYQPIARVLLQGQWNRLPRWSVWVHQRQDFTVPVKVHDGGRLEVGHFQPKHNLQGVVASHMRHMDEVVCGSYSPRPNCGTPRDALMVKDNGGDGKNHGRVFLMLHPTPLGRPEHDSFVWTADARKHEVHEYREVFMHVKPGAFVADVDAAGSEPQTMDVFWPGYWRTSAGPDTLSDGSTWKRTKVAWGVAAGRISDGTAVVVLAKVTAGLRDFPELNASRMLRVDVGSFSGGHYVKLPATERDSFLQHAGFVAGEVQSANLPKRPVPKRAEEDEDDGLGHLRGKWLPVHTPGFWCLAAPEIRYHKGGVVVEDANLLGRYEDRLKSIQKAVTVGARREAGAGEGEGASLEVVVGLQPAVLTGKAVTHLLGAYPSSGELRRLLLKVKVRTYVTVQLDHCPPVDTEFADFSEKLRPCEPVTTTGVCSAATRAEIMALGDPPRFLRQGHKLRPGQLHAVRWMVMRERALHFFAEEEIEEEVVPSLHMRVVGRAVIDKAFPFCAKGGVVAHEVGYGKTVTMLAIIDHQHEKSTTSDPLSELLPEVFQHAGTRQRSAFTTLRATLIIVPAHITKQWQSEALKFLGPNYKVLIFDSFADVSKATLQRVTEADIIIISSAAFSDASYRKQLCTLSDQVDITEVGHASLTGRQLEYHYQSVVSNSRAISEYYWSLGINTPIPDGEKQVNEILIPAIRRRAQERFQDEEARIVQPSSRKGKRKQPHDGEIDDEMEAASQKKPTMKETQPSRWTTTWIHNFSFARIIWDEFSYENELVELFVKHAIAPCKWLLSGTPKMDNLQDICRTARIFGVHVARPEPQMPPGLPAVCVGPPTNEFTKSEQFRALLSPVKTVDLAVHRHHQAERFVAQFYRANNLEDDCRTRTEEIVTPAAMTRGIAATYFVATRELQEANHDYSLLPSDIRTMIDMEGHVKASSKGDERLARIFLLLSACGVGRSKSPAELHQALVAREAALEQRLRLLFDKAMFMREWLQHFVRGVGVADSPQVSSIRNHLSRLQSDFAGVDELVFSWPDFFQLTEEELTTLDNSDIQFLLRAASRLWKKSNPNQEIPMDAFFSEDSRAARSHGPLGRLPGAGRPGDNNDNLALQYGQAPLGFAPSSNIGSGLLLALIRAKRKLPDSGVGDEYSGWTKAKLVEELRSANVEVAETAKVSALKRLLWMHTNGWQAMINYRDGRGHVPTHDQFPLASDESSFADTIDVIKDTLERVNATREDLKAVGREIRFASRFAQLMEGYNCHDACEHCGQQLESNENSFLIVSCGHLICLECRQKVDVKCIADNCGALTFESPILRCSSIYAYSNAQKDRVGQIVDFINGISSEEYIVVFAQFKPMLRALERGFTAANISFTHISELTVSTSGRAQNIRRAAELLEKFKQRAGGRVCLLDIDSELSAGSNLVVANHIIFATPYMHENPATRARVIRQAKARCVRTGQQNLVKIYHFMGMNTIEERVLRQQAETDPAFAQVFHGCHREVPWWLDGIPEVEHRVVQDVPAQGDVMDADAAVENQGNQTVPVGDTMDVDALGPNPWEEIGITREAYDEGVAAEMSRDEGHDY